jgi:hypothetical protein
MYEDTSATLGGEVKERLAKPKSRAEKIADWHKENEGAYKKACADTCTCTPTRAQILLLEQWDSPPVD